MKKVPDLNNSDKKPAIYSRDQHNISRQNIDEDALKIMYRLIRNGYKAFLVGGGVRDLLLSKRPKDFDIGTDATPRRIKSLFRNSRIIGRRFKLVHIFFRGNKNIEVSTFRDENEEIPENNEVLKTDNVYGHEATDALRRDITINGLFYDLANFSVIDYVGGMHDLHDGVIRVIGDPDKRFADDPVRLLRVIRHAARNNFDINKECWESLVRNRELIVKSSAVRVYEEVKKDLVSGHFLEILILLEKSGLLDYILPVLSGENSKYLHAGNIFHDIVKKIDLHVQSNQTMTATASLTIMALVLLYCDENIVLNRGDSQETIKEFIRTVFLTLSVPRKEKERIQHIISIIHELSTKDLKKLRLNALSRKPFFKDLIIIAGIIKDKLLSDEVMKALNAAQSNMRQEKSEFDSSRPHRYFNKVRRPK